MNHTAPSSKPWQRLHAALMPDYNLRATIYWWAVVVAGYGVLLACLGELMAMHSWAWVQVAAAVAAAVAAGWVPLRIPGIRSSFAASDVPIFLLLLSQGPAAAALATAIEAGVASSRTSKRWTSRLFSPAASGLSLWLTGSALQAALARLQPAGAELSPALLLGAMLVFAAVQFVFSMQLVSGVLRLKRGEPFMHWSDVTNIFRWVGLAYGGSASLAALLYVSWHQSGPGVVLVMVPLLALVLVALHFYFRQQETQVAMRETQAQAAEREAAMSARAAQAAELHLHELRVSEQRFQAAFTHASIGMALLAFDGRILQANPALGLLLGVGADALRLQPLQRFADPADRSELEARLGLADQKEFEAFSCELRCRHRDGSEVWASLHCNFFTEPGAAEPCLILQAQDITARRRAEAGLQHMAFHDALTGLPNRRRFMEVLSGALQRQRRAQPPHQFAVMYIDFDRFKLINDSLGHNTGDELLVQVARRLQEQLRPHDIVARMGGDEFAVLTDNIDSERTAVLLAERLMAAFLAPFYLKGVDLVCSASIGITFSSLGYDDADTVLRDADIAMYRAKHDGKARFALFDASLHQAVSARLRLEGDLRRAIDQGQLTVCYQPVMELLGGQLIGFEALVRWQHPQRGELMPGEFLPVAEETEMMVPLSDFVLHCACLQLRQWQLLGPAHAQLGMQVNVAAADLAQASFVAKVSRALVEAGIRPQDLTLELTESSLTSRVDTIMHTLTELRRLGVRLAVDDFGTGASSLSQLARLPVDSLKIDRSFIQQMAPGSDDAAVVQAIVQLGRSLRRTVVAEGIETAAQMAQLQAMGCAQGQGYHLGRPLTTQEATALLIQPTGPTGPLLH
jgi:diguanylate cyclase (GGDEF)-like protein/PAS domain S-box-containing protein